MCSLLFSPLIRFLIGLFVGDLLLPLVLRPCACVGAVLDTSTNHVDEKSLYDQVYIAGECRGLPCARTPCVCRRPGWCLR